MTTATQIPTRLRPEFRALLAHSVREELDDPGYGLELTESIKRRLRAGARSEGRNGVSLAEIRKK